MNRIFRIIALTLAFFISSTLDLKSQPNSDWIKIGGGHERTILADTDKVVLPLRVLIHDSILVNEMKFELREVLYNRITDQRLMQAFQVDSALSTERQIIISIDLQPLVNRPGVYELFIEASGKYKTKKDEENSNSEIVHNDFRLELPLKLTHPKASLQAIQTRRVEVVNPFPIWWANPSVRGRRLFLQETSGNSRLTHIDITPVSFSDEGSKPIDVTLMLEDSTLSLAPNNSKDATINIEGDFPLGRTTGRASINAPQLEGPVTVDFEIVRRNRKVWIVVMALLGLGLGFWLKHGLKNRIALSDARLKAIAIRKRIQKEIKDYPDEVFKACITKIDVKLKKILEDSKVVDDIKKESDGAIIALDKALQDLKDERKKEIERLKILLAITSYRDDQFGPPESMRSILLTVHTKTQIALDSVRKYQVLKARNEIDDLKSTLLDDKLGDQLHDWKTEVNTKLNIRNTRLPASVLEIVKNAFNKLTTKLDEIPKTTSDTTLEQYKSYVEKVNYIRFQLRALIQFLKYEFIKKQENTLSELGRISNIPNKAAIENFHYKMKTFLDKLEDEWPEKTLEIISNKANDLGIAWEKAITEQYNDQQITQLISEGKYVDAAKQAASSIGERDNIKDSDADANELSNLIHMETHYEWESWPMRASFSDTVILEIDKAPLRERRLDEITVRREKRFYLFIQYSILIFLLVIVGYLLYYKDFIGTPEQMMSIAMWAFGLDVGTSVIIEQVKRISA